MANTIPYAVREIHGADIYGLLRSYRMQKAELGSSPISYDLAASRAGHDTLSSVSGLSGNETIGTNSVSR